MANPHDEIREMGLRARSASLPRVEAAAREAITYVRSHYDESIFPQRPPRPHSEVYDGEAAAVARLTCDNILREFDERLAAADACEAERNPNTTDEIERLRTVIHNAGIAVRFRRPSGAFGQSMESTMAYEYTNDLITEAVAIERARQQATGYRWDGPAVSPEDVHREER